jgi:hypothetical protein
VLQYRRRVLSRARIEGSAPPQGDASFYLLERRLPIPARADHLRARWKLGLRSRLRHYELRWGAAMDTRELKIGALHKAPAFLCPLTNAVS